MVADIIQTGLSSWWAPGLAFAAGVVSFASPCVFPLVPGYLSFVCGSGVEGERRPVLPILLFILGFAIVFTTLGASATAVRFIKGDLGLRIAGAVVVVFGLVMLAYAFRLGWVGLYAERRPFLSRVRPGPVGALPLGAAFAAGWTPCIGPVLGGILALAGSQGSAIRGGVLLFVYSLGLGVPFFLIGIGVRRLLRALEFVKRNYHWFAGVSGVLMVAIGVMLVSGLWQTLMTPFLNRLSRVLTPPL
jgi:cytochrome c-type biogenesis protein